MWFEQFVLIYFVIILIVGCLIFIAIRRLPRIDKSFNTVEPLSSNTDCLLGDAVSALKLVNQMENVDGI